MALYRRRSGGALAILVFAGLSTVVCEAKCIAGQDALDRLYGPIVVLSPRASDTPGERARVREVRQRLRTLLLKLGRTETAVAAGYALRSSVTTAGYTYVPRAREANEGATAGVETLDVMHANELIYKKSPLARGSRLIGARYASRRSPVDQLDALVPLNLARWSQRRYRCVSPAALVLATWSVDVFPFAPHP